MIRAVIFDLDDTLYPEREFAFSGFAAVARTFAEELGNPRGLANRMRQLFDTEHRRRVFNRLLDELQQADQAAALVPRMIETYRTHRPDIELFPDASKALYELAGRYKLGLITDGPARMQRAKLHALRLVEASASRDTHRLEGGATADIAEHEFPFDAIVVTDELGPNMGKPGTGAFELMAARLGVASGECVYVADNPAKDFVAPNRLGWRSVRIVRPGGVYADAPTAEGGTPQETISSLDELVPLLG
jgi:putative hydrolase of the HAD superfamily